MKISPDSWHYKLYVFMSQWNAAWRGKDNFLDYPKHATMMCGEDPLYLGALEAPFLYQLLTTGEAPAIVCKKTVSEYLGDVSWKCEMDEL